MLTLTMKYPPGSSGHSPALASPASSLPFSTHLQTITTRHNQGSEAAHTIKAFTAVTACTAATIDGFGKLMQHHTAALRVEG